MLRILGAHSAIHPIPDETSTALGERDELFLQQTRNFDKSAAMAGCLRWAEKTPKHVHHVDFIRRHRPAAKFLGMVRDPRDTANSLRKRFGSLSAGIERWICDNLALEPHVGKPYMHLVRYEDLVVEPNAVLDSIMSFLGERPERAQLEFYQRPVDWYAGETKLGENQPLPEDNIALRNWQINRPLFDGRRKWEKELLPAQVAEVVSRTKDLAARFGYDIAG